jgi:hypothetical protein
VLGKAIWIEGGTRSGKTKALVDQFCQWLDERTVLGEHLDSNAKILVLAANDDTKRDLVDSLSERLCQRLSFNTGAKDPIFAKTTIGFIQDEVLLFYPLLIQKLNLPPQIPLRLRPETEQELATKLWQPALDRLNWREIASSEYRFVRRILDLLQLAAYSCTRLEDLPEILSEGFGFGAESTEIYHCVESLAGEWRDWCLDRGLLTYGIMTELYWRHLLPQPEYQTYLRDRYWTLLADDIDDYPAIGRSICDFLLDTGVWGAFTYNPNGMVRLGLSADPHYLLGLKSRCIDRVESSSSHSPLYLDSIETQLFADKSSTSITIDAIVQAAIEPSIPPMLPSGFRSIETRTRGEMLKATAYQAIELITSEQVSPSDIAIIAPGLDAISRSTITNIFAQQQQPIASLSAQLPLNSDPGVRALLTLMALIYPNLGQLSSRDEVADLLVTLSPIYPAQTHQSIDPVRAGLLADYCYAPSLSQPRLLPYENFPRWDRLGSNATKAYNRILAWVESVREQQPTPLNLLIDAIGYFFQQGAYLPFDRLSPLRELMETAQHYWLVAERTHGTAEYIESSHQITAQFILMLRQGTVTANPYPVGQLPPQQQAVTLSNIFQYRASKQSHAYHFWLDVGSPLWAEAGAATLYGANLLLKDRTPQPWTEADTQASDAQRLERILRDLLHRVNNRLYLCNSDLAMNGQEQIGSLLTLVHGVNGSK